MSKDEALYRLARLKVGWLLSMADSVWACSVFMIGFSFLAGFYLAQVEYLASAFQWFAIAFIFYGTCSIIRSFRRLDRGRLSPDEEQLTELMHRYLAERLKTKGDQDD